RSAGGGHPRPRAGPGRDHRRRRRGRHRLAPRPTDHHRSTGQALDGGHRLGQGSPARHEIRVTDMNMPDAHDIARTERRDEERPARRRSSRSSERSRSIDPARLLAYDVLRSVAQSDSYANLLLPPLMRRHGVYGRDAAFTTELTYGTLRLRGRYDAILAIAADRDPHKLDDELLDLLRLGCHQLLGMRVPAHAAVSETVALARTELGTGRSQLV